MYEQSLYKILPDHIKPSVIKKNNRYKKWEYGYNKEYDVVVISKTGQIGDIYEIQNLKIALPKNEDVCKFKKDRWERLDYPKELDKIASVSEWNGKPEYFKEKYIK